MGCGMKKKETQEFESCALLEELISHYRGYACAYGVHPSEHIHQARKDEQRLDAVSLHERVLSL